jgi:hypothetical protein
MKKDNSILISFLSLAVVVLGYLYLKKNNKDKSGVSGDAVLNGAVVPSNNASSDTSKADKEKADKEKADKEKADKEKEAQEKANRERTEKETLDKANTIARRLLSVDATIRAINSDLTFHPYNPNSLMREMAQYQNEKNNLLYDLSNLGYMWSYPNNFATKR